MQKMIEDISVQGQFFDEDFFAYKEDVDVAWRAALLGWRSRYEPLAQAMHVRQWQSGAGRKRMPLAIRRHSYLNRYLMMIKNGRLNGLGWLKLPALIVYEAALTAYFLLKDPRVFGSWVTMRQLIPRAFRKRRMLKEMERKASRVRSAKI